MTLLISTHIIQRDDTYNNFIYNIYICVRVRCWYPTYANNTFQSIKQHSSANEVPVQKNPLEKAV